MRTQRRLASEIMKVGKTRVWIDPNKTDDVEAAISRVEIRSLIHEGVIKARPKKGVSRSRARLLHEKRKKGRRRGSGSRSGKKTARTPRKEAWKNKIRALRRNLRELRDRRLITKKVYRRLYLLAKGGSFENVSDLKTYVETRKLKRLR